jgi:hypothetical protein
MVEISFRIPVIPPLIQLISIECCTILHLSRDFIALASMPCQGEFSTRSRLVAEKLLKAPAEVSHAFDGIEVHHLFMIVQTLFITFRELQSVHHGNSLHPMA